MLRLKVLDVATEYDPEKPTFPKLPNGPIVVPSVAVFVLEFVQSFV